MSAPARALTQVAPLLEALAQSPDAVFVTDRHNHIVFWNRSAERMLGYTADEAAEASCVALLQGCDVYGNRYCSENCPVTQMAARGETVRHFDLRLRARDLHTVVVNVSILHLALDGPDRYLLAHIMSPASPSRPESDEEARPAPPRSTLEAARESPDARARRLSPREVEVLGMLAAGHPTPSIAARLHISALTARNHIQNILDKLEVHSKAEAVAFAFQKRLL